MAITVDGGLVTGAFATGMFSSLTLPTIGGPGLFSMNIPEFDLTVDPGADFLGHDLDMELGFGNEGFAESSDVPEPTTALLFLTLVPLGLFHRLRGSRQHRFG